MTGPDLDAEVELTRLIERARSLMQQLQPHEVRAMVKTADALLDQWQRWFSLIGRDREGA